MNSICWGLFFATLNFNIEAGASTIGLLPSFVGYILIVKGCKEYREKSDFFRQAIPFATVMIYLSLVEYLLDLTGISLSLGMGSALLTVPGILLMLISYYFIVKGIEDLENKNREDYESERMMLLWKIEAITMAISTAVIYVLPAAAIVAVLVSCVVSILFLIRAFHTKKLMEPSGAKLQ